MRRLILAATLLAGVVSPALAAETIPFTQPAFAAAQQANKPILVEIDAPWCPNCAKQRPILAKLAAEPDFKDLLILKIDFDSQKDAVRALGATMQSTLVAFHGPTERGRVVGVTDETMIRTLVGQTRN